jgi:flavodoxin
MKKILIISGSPRRGNTEYILTEIYSGLRDGSD